MTNRSSANPNGSHPMQRTMAARAAQRARFATWLINLLDERGVPQGRGLRQHMFRYDWIVARGFSRSQASMWVNGHSTPMLHQLPELAEKFGVDLVEVCVATGRPPADAARLRFTTDRDGALSTLVHRFRTSRGWTHEELSGHVGLSAGTLSRLESGSRIDIRLPTAVAIADAFGITVAEVATAARAHAKIPGDLDKSASDADRAYAAALRQGRTDRKLDVERAAALTGVTAPMLRSYETGESVPREVTLLRASVLYRRSLPTLLTQAGYADSPAQAKQMARVLTAASHMCAPGTFADTLRTARLQANMTVVSVAENAGVSRFEVSRYQSGAIAPTTLARVLKLSKAVAADPVPLVAAWVAQAA